MWPIRSLALVAMEPIVQLGTAAHKEKTQADFLLPGPALASYIRKLCERRRPYVNLGLTTGESATWHALVPHLDKLLVLERGSSGAFNFGRIGEPLRCVFSSRVAVALALEDADTLDLAIGALTHDDRATWRRLSFAALRDIHDIDTGALTTAVPRRTDRSTTREDCRIARAWLSRIGAWPWYCFGASGKPPDDWWSQAGASPEADRALARWANVAPVRLAEMFEPLR